MTPTNNNEITEFKTTGITTKKQNPLTTFKDKWKRMILHRYLELYDTEIKKPLLLKWGEQLYNEYLNENNK